MIRANTLRSFDLAKAATIVFLLLVAPAANQAQTTPATPTDAARKQSTVHGRVVYDDNRHPLRRVQVSIYDPAERNARRELVAWTNSLGEFQIKNVPVGKYYVVVTAPGIVPSDPYGAQEGRIDLTSVTVDGTAVAELIVRVKRGAAISGKIVYADGDPVINASIRVLRKKDSKWISVYVGSGSNDRVLTDERGMFRVSGLLAGDYLIGAAEEKWGVELSARDGPDGGYLLNRALLGATFYDGATSFSSATVISLQAGEEKNDINLTLADRALRSISGMITIKGSNRPVVRARIALKRKDENAAFGSEIEDTIVNSDEKGRFTFDEVQDGNYTMAITPPRGFSRTEGFAPSSSSGEPPKFVAKELELTVAGADLADLMIEVFGGSRISGIVTVEGGKPLPPNVIVYTATAGPRPAQGSPVVKVGADGSFSLDGNAAGLTYLRVSVAPDNQYYTKTLSIGKSELARGPMMVKEDEDISNVHIVISPDIAVLTGRVLLADGRTPQPGANVLLQPTDPDQLKWTDHRIFSLANADGVFRITVPPGEYLMIVLQPGESPFQLSPEVLRSRFANGRRVVLQPAETSKVELIVPANK